MKKLFLISLAIVIVGAGLITFMYVSNDHSECERTSIVTYGKAGEKITTETHICNEKYNL
ncbi:hypothetical protein [Formosa sp. Hel1_31_208]|uniref:hypothetical protein n=1 Tax=Formosa sp. Hel1_31_208 TaxID=1798225 RepID=UPI0012FD7958|nr:hypothetical protein [Formosa sp. Hel1_31_208]